MDNESPARRGAVPHLCLPLHFAMLLAAAASFGPARLHAQSIPAMNPTRLGVQQRTTPDGQQTPLRPLAQPSIPTPALTSMVAHPSRVRHRADVIVSGANLEIRADNSSLNGILSALSQQTGLTITGGVMDQRVFGTYGPGPAAEVLTQLLQDTGTNMILCQTPEGALGELILSPRLGGPTPPSPSSFRQETDETQVSTPTPQPAISQPLAPQPSIVPPLPFSKTATAPAATDTMQTSVTPDPQGIVDPPTVAPATEPGTTPGPTTQSTGLSDTTSGRASPSSSNAVKTPQQIYEELQQLKQQQDKQQQH